MNKVIKIIILLSVGLIFSCTNNRHLVKPVPEPPKFTNIFIVHKVGRGSITIRNANRLNGMDSPNPPVIVQENPLTPRSKKVAEIYISDHGLEIVYPKYVLFGLESNGVILQPRRLAVPLKTGD